MAPMQPECRKGKIPVILARTQNFAQPLDIEYWIFWKYWILNILKILINVELEIGNK